MVERDVLAAAIDPLAYLGHFTSATLGTSRVHHPVRAVRTLCISGLRKTYWTPCVVERDVLAAAIDPAAYPSSIIASPRDLNRLLANFQPTLGEITVIATEALNPSMPGSAPSQEGEPETRAVELRSYVDPSASCECGISVVCCGFLHSSPDIGRGDCYWSALVEGGHPVEEPSLVLRRFAAPSAYRELGSG